MKPDLAKVDDAVLALLALFASDDRVSWKNYDYEATTRLHEQGFIDNPINKNKSLVLTDEGLARGRALAERLFAR